jgi:hypothetical protein
MRRTSLNNSNWRQIVFSARYEMMCTSFIQYSYLSPAVLNQCGCFYPRPVSVNFALCKVTSGEVCLQVLRFSYVNIIPKMPHSHHHLRVCLSRGNPGEAWHPVKEILQDFKWIWLEKCLYFLTSFRFWKIWGNYGGRYGNYGGRNGKKNAFERGLTDLIEFFNISGSGFCNRSVVC